MAKKVLIIEADYNDGDYVSERFTLMDEQLAKLMPIINEIKKHNGKWDKEKETYYVNLSPKQIELFEQYVPFAPDGDDIHTITSIKLLIVLSETTLL